MKKSFSALILILLTSFLFAERPIVNNIKAVPAGKSTNILVVWNLPENPDKPITRLKLYRSTRPVFSYKELSDSTLIAELNGDEVIYTDTVNDFKNYYYTVIAVTDRTYEKILVSMNTTINGVHLTPVEVVKKDSQPSESISKREIRETPLPFLDLIDGLDTEKQISEKYAKETEVFGTQGKAGTIQIKYPYFFEEDLITPDDKDGIKLFDILKDTFIQRKYKDSTVKLEKFIKTNITQDVKDRAIFYLAESQFFNEDYKNAVMNFIKVEKKYPLLCKKWINASLDKLSIK
ncbi:MAG: hypothetical protein MJ174_00930 [Treponema sp.]|nr:hypothetical protein [Treponema sp.]